VAATRVWHAMTAEAVVSELRTDGSAGLTSAEAAARLASVGPNQLRPPERTPAWKRFLGQFNDFMIWVLAVAVLVSAFEGEVADAIAILAILLINGILGYVQESRAERAMEALRELAAPTATVVRDGRQQTVPAAELVPGDVVVLAAGDSIPADGRLLEAAALRIDESSLTGESVPGAKRAECLGDEGLVLGDRRDMVYASTSVATGRGRFVVTETGEATEVGRIAELLEAQEPEATPLQRELKTVGKRIAIAVLAVAALVFAIGVWQTYRAGGDIRAGVTTALLVAISLAVAAIPEGLPATVTVALSLGVRRMAERNAIVRKLHAVETLGATTFICSDKTGTLTRNEMRVRRIVVGTDDVEVLPDWAERPLDRVPDTADRALLLRIAASCNDAEPLEDGGYLGDPTETALLAAADHLEAPERLRPPRIAEVPFDSERKRMTTVHELDGERMAYMKGGADVVLGLCTHARLHGELTPMTEELLLLILECNEALASTGYRTLALAFRALSPSETAEEDTDALENSMTYVGLVGLVDPPRPEVPAAIETCRHAGIHVAMITGDHALTARAIGREVGLLTGDERVVSGAELEQMSDAELARVVEDVRVYARVDPAHKLRIVDALKSHGEVVAMTGDGVNDAPALKRADIGVAMGLVGTDVSREASDMILGDDDFATIVEAVHQGRAVFDNLRKVILFLLSCNASEVLIVFLTTFFSTAGPVLLPLELLWINLVTDGLPALALGVDPAQPGIMDRPPRSAEEGILVRRRQWQIVWQGALLAAAGLLVYVWADFLSPGHSPQRARTMLFTAIVLVQLLHAFDFRSDTRSIWSLESLRNRWLIAALIGSMALQMLVIYLPALQPIFATVPLGLSDWLAVILAALLPIIVIDVLKVTRAQRR
jgi:P-type Ca2+ transporter type 2C